MRVLVVLAQKPMVEGTAAAKCAAGFLRGLQLEGVELKVLAASFGYPLTMPPDLDLEIIGAPRPRTWSERWQRVRVPRGHLGRGRFAARARELAQHVDVVHLDELESAAARPDVAVPAALHLHFLIGRDRGMGVPWRRSALDWIEIRAAERRAARRNPWLIANSPEVAAELHSLSPRSEVRLIPLALDANAYPIAAPLEEPVAGLIGTGDWGPTDEAVRRLVSRVWPRVRRLVPHARLRLAGRGMELAHYARVPGATEPHLEWLGSVDSARDFVADLGVLLYPLSRGSGTKVKVLESLAMGVPVVTTSAGAEGLVSRDGVAVRDDDDEFAETAASLLLDEGLRAEAGRAARENFLAHHTPDVVGRALVDLYERMLG